jgi:hypothetical protein
MLAPMDIVDEVVAALIERRKHTERLDLDDVAEVIGDRAISYDQVDEILLRMERAGHQVGEPAGPGDVAQLRRVLEAARALQTRLGRKPTVEEIAAETELAPFLVRRALELGKLAGPRTLTRK